MFDPRRAATRGGGKIAVPYCPPDQLSKNLVASNVPPVMTMLRKKQPITSVAIPSFSRPMDSASNCQAIGITFLFGTVHRD